MPTGDPTNLAQLGIHWGDRQATIEKDSLCEGNAQGMFPRPPGEEQRPVDVEEQKFFAHDGEKLARIAAEVAPKLAGRRRRAESIVPYAR